MKVYTFESSGPAQIPESELDVPSGPRIGWMDALPPTGYWKVGDKLVIGSTEYICTVEGSPGIWNATGGGGGSGPLVTNLIRSGTPDTAIVIEGNAVMANYTRMMQIINGGENVVIPDLDPIGFLIDFIQRGRNGIDSLPVLKFQSIDSGDGTSSMTLELLTADGSGNGMKFGMIKSADGVDSYMEFQGNANASGTIHFAVNVSNGNGGIKAAFHEFIGNAGGETIQGRLWYDEVAQKFKFFDGNAVQTITSL